LSSKRFDGKVTATVTVTNTGKVAGKDVVQLYISAPAQKLSKPESELRGFAKTELLQPRQSQTISFTVTGEDLASFDPSSSSWIAEAGTYTVKIGTSSTNTRQSATLDVRKEILVEKVNKVLTPKVKINELQVK
jgi:beta-glucosidase